MGSIPIVSGPFHAGATTDPENTCVTRQQLLCSCTRREELPTRSGIGQVDITGITTMKKEIICIGEILWDSLPAGLFLGGAPFNVAHDLHMLGSRTRIISRVGRDRLGDEVMKRLGAKRISTDLIQRDDRLPTGLVEVFVDEKGNPTYNIRKPAAWDAIEVGEVLMEIVRRSGMIVFGTLACRNEVSRRTIHTLIEAAPLRTYDVNLRAGVEERDLVGELLNAADIVKVNSAEIVVLRNWFGLPSGDMEAAEKLARTFSCKLIAVSLGAHGGSMWHEGVWVSHPGFSVKVETTVGAGDAFLAGLLTSLTEGKSDEEIIETANLLGSYVVTRNEAAPEFDWKEIESIRANAKRIGG